MSQQFTVQGNIIQDGGPASEVLVKAFDKDLPSRDLLGNGRRSEDPLGEATTDTQGHYEIGYTDDHFTRGEKRSADLFIRVFSANKRQLGMSEVLFNAPPNATVDLVLLPQPEPVLSEYELHLAELTPVLDDIRLADLTDDDLTFLVGESGMDRPRLELVRHAAQLARETRMPTEVFYGFGRHHPPLDLDQLLALPPQMLHGFLEAAITENIIPAGVRESFDEIMRRFEQLRIERGLLESRQVIGRLLNETSGAPLGGLTVRAFDLGGGPNDLGHDVTSEEGLFAFGYVAPPHHPPAEGESSTTRRLLLRILDAQARELHQTEIQVQADRAQVVVVRVPVAAIPEPSSPAVGELANILDLRLPPALLPFLAKKGIHTLADIRKAGGVSRLEGLTVRTDHPAVQNLDAHARLSGLSSDLELNTSLINKGFTSMAAIAKAPRSEFIALASERLGDFKSAQMHVVARAQTHYASSIMTSMRADRANHFAFEDDLISSKFGALMPEVCGCDDCHAAVSPLAYLADLLDYALHNLEPDSAGPMTLQLLTDTFHQPFGDLPATCEAVLKQVRQVRICIEVLRSVLGKRPLANAGKETALKDAEKAYLLDAYTMLLTRMGVSYEEIRLARTEKDKDRKQLSERMGIDLGTHKPDPLDALFLDADAKPGSPNAITEQNLEKLFGLVETDRPNPLTDVPTPDLLTWRLAHLRTLWKEQDRPTDPYAKEFSPPAERLPIIDPDLIGPDDFQNPLETESAFKVWLTRRKLVVDTLNGFRKDREAGKEKGMEIILGAALGTAIAEIDGLVATLKEGAKADVEKAKERVRSLHLTVESFSRLMELREKDQRAANEKLPALELTEEEWREVYSILTQRKKEGLFSTWIKEEEDKTSEIFLGPENFWLSEREPTDGDWPPLMLPGLPLIDPETVKPVDLPERTAGKQAINFWKERRKKLDDLAKALRDERKNGLEAVLVKALGPPTPETPPTPKTTWGMKLATLKELLNSGKPEDAEKARKTIQDTLHLSAKSFEQLASTYTDSFGRLALLNAKDEAAHRPVTSPTTPPPRLNEAEWTEVVAILTSAQKVRELFPIWKTEESSQKLDVEYWRARKARLERWRATTEARQQWRRGLQSRSALPLIDPDLVHPADFKEPSVADRAYKLWEQRRKDLEKLRKANVLSPKTKEGLATLTQKAIGIELNELIELAEAEKTGEGIEARLDQLSLTREAFNYVLRISVLLSQSPPAPVLESEWVDVSSILTQAQKQRLFAQWRNEEKSADLIGGPDHFRFPTVDPTKFPPPLREKLTPWLAMREDRLNWEDTLQTRLDQEATVIEALQTAVSATEEATLPSLRDALVMAVAETAGGLPSADRFDAKIKWITDHLLIDAKADGCQLTTRITQAIETVQNLLFSVRTEQFRGKPKFLLDGFEADEFEETWKWMGSYPTWRAAMFVHLYPENILLPSLRKWQTPAFRALVSDLRGSRRLTPEQACDAYKTYSLYFEDITNLTLEASCQTATRVQQREGCHHVPGNDYRYLFYMFARGGATNKVYWSVYDPTDPSGYAQSFWQEVEGLGDNVTNIVGAVPYHMAGPMPSDKERKNKVPPVRFIFLFATTQEKGQQNLVFIKYDLEKQRWAGDKKELDLPSETTTFTVGAVQNLSEHSPPEMFLHGSRKFLLRNLNPEGTDWAKVRKAESAASDKSSDSNDEWELYQRNDFYGLDQYLTFKIDKPGPLVNAEIDDAVARIPPSSRGPLEPTPVVMVIGSAEFRKYLESLRKVFDSVVNSRRIHKVHAVLSNAGKTFICLTNLDGDLITVVKGSGSPSSGFEWNHKQSVWIGAILPPLGNAYIFYNKAGQPFYELVIAIAPAGSVPPATTLPGLSQVIPGAGDVPLSKRQVAYQLAEGQIGLYRCSFKDSLFGDILNSARGGRVAPQLIIPFDEDRPAAIRAYLDDMRYFVPMHLALQLQRAGQFTAALDWFRRVYDYSKPEAERKIPKGIEIVKGSVGFKRGEDWLLDPINPHHIATKRRNTYTRFTVLSLARCLQEFADAEFTRDTPESVPRARTLYLTELELLNCQALRQGVGRCEDLIGNLDIQIGDPVWFSVWDDVKVGFTRIQDADRLKTVLGDVTRAFGEDAPLDARFAKARGLIAEALSSPPPQTFTTALDLEDRMAASTEMFLFSQPAFAEASEKVGAATGQDFLESVVLVSGLDAERLQREKVKLPWLVSSENGKGPARDLYEDVMTARSYKEVRIPAPSISFCIPPNPILKALRLHAELNLYKLRTCRNIAGMERQLEHYAAPTDTKSGLPMIGPGGQLLLPGTVFLPATSYRYSTLLERAKQLVAHAQQIEASMFSALVQRDVESYNLLKARHDVRLTRAGMRLQDLRITEAQDGVDLATLQEERAEFQVNHYQGLLNLDISPAELAALLFMGTSVVAHISAAASTGVPSSKASSLANAASTTASIFSTLASYERRRDDWQFQRALAQRDVAISAQQVKGAQDHVRVVGQERVVAEIQSEHAEAVVEFLGIKFTNVELYDWMSDILGRVYSFFLQQATAMAQLAADQLAFERQEAPPSHIQADYWEAPSEDGIGGNGDRRAPDRLGLTGSARLLKDIYQLDEYAFATNKRKLQLTKTISLAQLGPAEFQRFRETGVMPFATPMEMFDRDFPGHYLRLIRRVRTSVVALIPPTQGIRATLTCVGLSHAVIGPLVFQTTPIRRDPQVVALSSPRDATGLFELDTQPEMLLPFEGLGVDTSWELRLPKAANFFDYSTIADVLITIEYSALDSADYRQQVIQTLRPTLSSDRPFSFRHQFADAWYDLNNPDQTGTPMTVRFSTTRDDFPPNLNRLKIQQVVLYFARANGKSFEVPVSQLRFTEDGTGPVGGGATSQEGIISTLRGNAGSWAAMQGKSPFGEWELALPNTTEMRNRLKKEEIQDILFVLTFSGRTPDWPA